jgi:hypothetical protein
MGMSRTTVIVIAVLVMIAIIVGVDVLLLRDHFWARLLVNVGIVATFAALYLTVLKKL